MLATVLLAALIAAVIFLLRKIQKHRQYWSDRGIPTPPLHFLFGNLLSLSDEKNPRPLQFAQWTRQMNNKANKQLKFYGIQEGWHNVLIVSDPGMLHELFVKKFEYFYSRKVFVLLGDVDKDKTVHVFRARGARWKRLRTITNPTFTVNNLKKIMPIIDDSVKHMIVQMEPFAQNGKPMEIQRFFQELTMDVIARIAMGQKESHLFESLYLDTVKRIFQRPSGTVITMLANSLPLLAPLISGIAPYLRVFADSNHLLKTIKNAVEERRHQRATGEYKEDPNQVDFIDLFLDAEAGEDFLDDGQFEKQGMKVQRKLTGDEIVAQLFVFLLAGFDTTANSLSYLSHCFAKNPDAMHRAQEEIDEICPDEKITYEQIMNLQYLDMAAKESLRMYPLAAQANSRICMETTQLGDVTVEKGVFVVADTMTLHFDPEVWGEDANEFRPERWESPDPMTAHSWIPFGAGPRTCIGMRLALIEEKLTMARILKEYDILACAETEDPLVLQGSATMSPVSVTVKFQKRKK